MNYKATLIHLVLQIFIIQAGFSQNLEQEKSIGVQNQEFLWFYNIDKINANWISTDKNVVFIHQIGDENEIKVKTKSNASDIKLYQRGSQNKIHIDVIAKSIEESISQVGNNNSVLDFSSCGVDQHQLDVSQEGNNQNLTWFGGNSMAEKLKIKMQGESKTIVIRNFN